MNTYKSVLARLIDEAIDNCIASGSGVAKSGEYRVVADWAYNETDIDLNIYEGRNLIGSFTERGVADIIY